MPTPTAAERLHALQQKNRKAAGLPDPSEYKKKLDYMKKEKFSNTHRREIMALLQRKLHINPKVRLIDIYPDHHDYKLFFANSFSLNSKVSAHAVEAGYKRTMQILSPR